MVVTGAGNGLFAASDPFCIADVVVAALGIASAIFESSISPSSASTSPGLPGLEALSTLIRNVLVSFLELWDMMMQTYVARALGSNDEALGFKGLEASGSGCGVLGLAEVERAILAPLVA